MKLKTLEDLFIHEVRDIYDAEQRLLKALRRMARAASSPELRSAFEKHRTQTENQVNRLEQVFAEFDCKPKGGSCEAVKGLVEVGRESEVRGRRRKSSRGQTPEKNGGISSLTSDL